MIELNVDWEDQGTPLNRLWEFGGNTCHAPLWLRPDLQRHLEIVRDELGFRHMRCHGMLSDNMGVYNGGGSFDFSKVNAALDSLLHRDMVPFFELSSMPRALARDDKSICEYRFYSSPPNDWSKWYDLIAGLMQNLKTRYGVQALRKWNFEVWNEPNIPFWSGTQEEYFHLYDLSARAIKELDREIRVGGPATARVQWIGDFVSHLKGDHTTGQLPAACDFISTHIYPSDVEYWEQGPNGIKLLESNIVRQLLAAAREQIDAHYGKEFPLICGEWNSAPYESNRDDCNNAAFVVKTMNEILDLCQGSLYWDISDIYEEAGWHYQPFHSGCGLLTVNDIRKSSFNAFRLLHRLEGRQLPCRWRNAQAGIGALASRDKRQYRVLVYYYREVGEEKPKPASFNLAGLPAKVYQLEVTRIVPHHGSAFETWAELGRPDFPTRDLLEKLENASLMLTKIQPHHEPLTIEPGTVMEISFVA